ncbi:MAG: family 43 glycosylhydrolase [Bacteroidales bacterium]|nr:family 43 glycosylhydrolase [Bacteroidales bacterium]
MRPSIKLIFIVFCYLAVDPIAHGQSPSFQTYMNPVIPGDHPDATLTRVGKDFYTIGSSFNPTPVLYHSTDLVHWEAIAQPVSASWTGYGDSPGGGCWGGQVVYYNNQYWHFFSRAWTMYYVKADHPEGPWGTPVKINNPTSLPYSLGYDNSVFIDDNNKWYLVVKNGQPNNGIVELGSNGQPTGVVYNLNWLNPEPSYPYSWAEGPVMWKYKGYYYYSFARDVAGGQKVMRSPVLTADQASWEVPVDFFNENDPLKSGSLFTSPNHSSAAILLDDSTSWVIHPLYAKGEWKGQGRQGLLNQVRYNALGKPTADYPVNKSFTAPKLPSGGIPWMVPKSDFFDSAVLHPEWSFMGYTPENTHSLSERPGWLRLSPRTNKINLIVKNDGEHNYSLITHLNFDALSVNDEAGLIIIRGDETKYVKLFSSVNSAGKKAVLFSFDNSKYEAINNIGSDLWLKITRVNHSISGYFSSDGVTWTKIGSSFNVSTIDSYSDFSTWAGTRQGLYVKNKPAFFDLYIYRDGFTPIMAGNPANAYGTVLNSAGNLDSIHHSDWALYAGVEFGNSNYGKTADSIMVSSSGLAGGMVEVWLDSIDTGMKIGDCVIEPTGSWTTFKTTAAKIDPTTGRHDVYLKFTGSSTGKLFQIKSFQFTAITAPHFVTASTTSDSTILLKLDKSILEPEMPSGLIIKINASGVDSIRQLNLNPADSSEIILTLQDKFTYADTLTVSYDSGNITGIDGMKLITFSNRMVQNTLPDTTFHIYLMFGQSNMEGQGAIEPQDRVTNPRVKVLQDLTCPNLNRTYGTWYTAAPPLNRCWSGLGPGDSFGRMMGESAPDYVTTIGLVNASVSGCNIYIYKKGCPDGLDEYSQGIPFDCGYSWLLDLAKKAQQEGIIKGILFHQGETNNTDPEWKNTVQQIVADLKADLGLGDIPFLAGELLYEEYGSCCSAHNIEIKKLPALIPNAHVISASGLPGSDVAHFTPASYRTLGERYARKMLELVYNVCDSNTIEPWYQRQNSVPMQGDSVLVQHGTQLVLSPHPVNLLGTWSWEGVLTSGTLREQVLNTTTEGSYGEMVTYTNECGAISRLPFKIVVCDSSVIATWHQINQATPAIADTIRVLQDDVLLLSPASDKEGTWNWSGAGTSGTNREQIINTATTGTYAATVTHTNACGAISRCAITIIVDQSNAMDDPERKGLLPVEIYPNPAKNSITVKNYSPAESMRIQQCIITNALGQVVLTVKPVTAETTHLIDISQLDEGMYTITLVGRKGLTFRKFLKIK